jgi:hypothetical protein
MRDAETARPAMARQSDESSLGKGAYYAGTKDPTLDMQGRRKYRPWSRSAGIGISLVRILSRLSVYICMRIRSPIGCQLLRYCHADANISR